MCGSVPSWGLQMVFLFLEDAEISMGLVSTVGAARPETHSQSNLNYLLHETHCETQILHHSEVPLMQTCTV